ncbi:MAG: low specificity L-threonine aldolase [Lachnospiraceae bacterium]|nr:low specificity L-threonine aldolase [Lachnospiraceae bacterium]
MLYFESDYMEGAHPEVMKALAETNMISTTGYGQDEYSQKAALEILEECGCPEGEVYFLTGGTQTNKVIIDSLLRSYEGVIAASSGHVSVHEAGAIEAGGHKVLELKGHEGKLSAEDIGRCLSDYTKDENRDHMVMPGMVYISQPTEYGTLYSLEELTSISTLCKEAGVYLYVDGARLAYALAAPENDVRLSDLARLSDVFYIGGTKCGLLFGEAVVFPKKGLIPHFFSICKQHGAVLAKGRLLGIQFGVLFKDGLYSRIGIPAIKNAARIKGCLLSCGFEMPFDSPTNQILFVAGNDFLQRISSKAAYSFMELWDDTHQLVRFATSWATSDEDTGALLELIRECLYAQAIAKTL